MERIKKTESEFIDFFIEKHSLNDEIEGSKILDCYLVNN